jgi:tetratricopeptide (TPR) repeat protein
MHSQQSVLAVSRLQYILTRFARRGVLYPFLALLAMTACGCKVAADGQNLQGVRLYQQGQYDAAMQTFQKAVANDPSNADAFYNMAATVHRLGVARNDTNLLGQAESLYNRCLDLDPSNTDCYRGLAVLLSETGRSDRAFTLLQNWAMRDPKSPEARIELARLYEEFGDAQTAKVHLTEALQIDQYSARAWNALGRLREQSGDYVQALANYQQSYSLNRFQPEVAERIASLNRSIAQSGTTQAPDTRTVTPSLPVNR